MKEYLLNGILGIFLGYIFGFIYISFIDEILFNNFISNKNDFDQSFFGAIMPIFIFLILVFLYELKEGIKDVMQVIMMIGSLIAAYFFSALVNLVFSFILILILGEYLFEKHIGGFISGSMSGFLIISYLYTVIKIRNN